MTYSLEFDQILDHEVVVFVVAVDKREGSVAYRKAAERLP